MNNDHDPLCPINTKRTIGPITAHCRCDLIKDTRADEQRRIQEDTHI